jgi:nitrate/nitrite-specific signal transduction histidine kinase
MQSQLRAAARYLQAGEAEAWREFTRLTWSSSENEARYLALRLTPEERLAVERLRTHHRVFEGVAQSALARRGDAPDLSSTSGLQTAYDEVDASAREVSRLIEERLGKATADAEAAAVRVGSAATAIALLFVLGLFVSSSLAVRGVLAPVAKLDDAAARLGRGDLAARAPVAGFAAVAQLCRRFNAMADELQALVQSMEERVAQRTEEREAMVRELLRRADELHAANRLLVETQQRLVEAERLAAVAQVHVTLRHEINNPLSVLAGAAEILRHAGHDPLLVQSWAAEMDVAAARISEVLRRLAELQRVETTDYVPGVTMVDLGRAKTDS